MARLARIVAPGLPHHITQRGNRRQPTFFSEEDYESYMQLMAEWCGAHGVEVRAYCLMPNHVHIIAVPQSADGVMAGDEDPHRLVSRSRSWENRPQSSATSNHGRRRGASWRSRFQHGRL